MVLALYLDILFQLQMFILPVSQGFFQQKGTQALLNIEIFKYVFSIIRLSCACV